MTEGIYQKLAKHLDDLPGGFPPTDSGLEMRILKRLFAPEEAELALHLTLIAEEPKVVARRVKISRQEAEQRLATIVKKGLFTEFTPRRISQRIWPLNISWEFGNSMLMIWTRILANTWKNIFRSF
ncbi:MAG: hypothetical protein PVH37_14520 [Desulfobacterales bacterium]|jgi:hypothetical protein